MATTRAQRIGIWIITGTMVVGTIGGFIAMMVAPGNEARDRAALEKAQTEYQASLMEHEKKEQEKITQLNAASYPTLAQYADRVAPFNAEEVKELKTEDLKTGEGAEVRGDSSVLVYYIGWNPNGEIFDQSIDGDKLKAAFPLERIANAQVISGWREGLIGMKIGGVRELTVPADKAYGAAGQGDKIPANTPLKFVVFVAAEKDPAPEAPKIIKDYYRRNYGQAL